MHPNNRIPIKILFLAPAVFFITFLFSWRYFQLTEPEKIREIIASACRSAALEKPELPLESLDASRKLTAILDEEVLVRYNSLEGEAFELKGARAVGNAIVAARQKIKSLTTGCARIEVQMISENGAEVTLGAAAIWTMAGHTETFRQEELGTLTLQKRKGGWKITHIRN